MSKSEFREWKVYGDYFQHPNGYPITNIKVLKFESGPLLDKDEKVHVIEKAALDEANRKLEVCIKALEDIRKYKFRSPGPGGCDSHCIEHPCGPCAELPNEKWVASKALEEIK